MGPDCGQCFVKVSRGLKKKELGAGGTPAKTYFPGHLSLPGGSLDPVNVTSGLFCSPVCCRWEEVRTHWPGLRPAELSPCWLPLSPGGAVPSPAPGVGLRQAYRGGAEGPSRDPWGLGGGLSGCGCGGRVPASPHLHSRCSGWFRGQISLRICYCYCPPNCDF